MKYALLFSISGYPFYYPIRKGFTYGISQVRAGWTGSALGDFEYYLEFV